MKTIKTHDRDRRTLELSEPDLQGVQQLRMHWIHTYNDSGVHVDRERWEQVRLSPAQRRELIAELEQGLMEPSEITVQGHPSGTISQGPDLTTVDILGIDYPAHTRVKDQLEYQDKLIYKLNQERAQPPEGSFWWAWKRMEAGETMEAQLNAEYAGQWAHFRMTPAGLVAGVARVYWELESMARAKWRIPPPAEPTRYEFAEALRLYQEQGARGIRYRDWSADSVLRKSDAPSNALVVLLNGRELPDSEYISYPAHFTGADWEIVPQDGQG